MTNEEMDRAIAEAVGAVDRWLIVKRGYFYRPNGCGYTSHEHEAWVLPLVEAKKHEYLIGEEPVTLSRASIPRYSTDLNAMHEAEMFMRGTLEQFYNEPERYRMVDEYRNYILERFGISATAHDRAEAFLRTIGKYHATHPLP